MLIRLLLLFVAMPCFAQSPIVAGREFWTVPSGQTYFSADEYHQNFHDFEGEVLNAETSDGSLYSVSKDIRPLGVLFIHGLWEGPKSLKYSAKIFKTIGINTINIALPGHTILPEKHLQAGTSLEWKDAVLQSLKILRAHSQKVIIVGQSLGGLLGSWATVYHPELVDGLVMIEPALKVYSGTSAMACSVPILNDDLRDLLLTGEKIHLFRVAEELTSLPTGNACEVVQLSKTFLWQMLKKPSESWPQKPLIALLNKDDGIVDNRIAAAFVTRMKGEVFQFKNYRGHGAATRTERTTYTFAALDMAKSILGDSFKRTFNAGARAILFNTEDYGNDYIEYAQLVRPKQRIPENLRASYLDENGKILFCRNVARQRDCDLILELLAGLQKEWTSIYMDAQIKYPDNVEYWPDTRPVIHSLLRKEPYRSQFRIMKRILPIRDTN